METAARSRGIFRRKHDRLVIQASILSMIALSILVIFSAAPEASAQPAVDVKGGFFDKEKIRRGFFPATEEPAAKRPEAAETNKAKTGSEDSWTHPETEQKDRSGSRDFFNKTADVIKAVKQMQHVPPPTTGVNSSGVLPATGIERSQPGKSRLLSEPSGGPSGPAEQAIVSLVVSAYPKEHLFKNLKRLTQLYENQNVRVGQVLIIGLRQVELQETKQRLEERPKSMTEQSVLESMFKPPLKTIVTKGFKLTVVGVASPEHVLKRLGVKASPAWVVRYGGKDYVYEGEHEPAHFFTSKGIFRNAEDDLSAVDNTHVKKVSLERDKVSLVKGHVEKSTVQFKTSVPGASGNRRETVFGKSIKSDLKK